MATTQIKDGFNGGSNNQLLVNADGSIDVNAATTISGPIVVNQGTSPWIISGSVSASQVGSWTVSVSNFPASTAVTQATSPWVVSGTVTANQGTSPWVTSGTATVSGTVAATQSGAWTTGRTWTLSSGTDSVNIGNFPASFAVTQATSPWVISGSATVSGTVAATQSGTWNINNISGTISLPTGAATDTLQTTGNTSLSSINTKTPALGQTTMAGSSPVVIASDQSAILIKGGIAITTGTVSSATDVFAAVDVSAYGSLSLQLVLTGTATVTFRGSNDNVNFRDVCFSNTAGSGTATTVALSNIIVIAPVQCRYFKPVVTAYTNGSITATLVAIEASQSSAQLSAVSRTWNLTSGSDSVSGPALTKGTQAATGFSVQNLKDAGRTSLSFYALGVAAGTTTTETAVTLIKSSGTSATTTATSFVVTSGKRFRIESITVNSRGNITATDQVTTFSLRINTGGAVTTTSTPLVFSARTATPATGLATDRISLPIPDGYEILGDGTLQFGVTANSVYTLNAPTWDVNIIGFEY